MDVIDVVKVVEEVLLDVVVFVVVKVVEEVLE